MVLTIIMSTVFNCNKNCDCSKLYYAKISEEFFAKGQASAILPYRQYPYLFAAVLCSVYRIQQPINPPLPPPKKNKSQHIQTENRTVVNNDDLQSKS